MTNVTFPQLNLRGCVIDIHLKVMVATIDGVSHPKSPRSFNTFTSCLTEKKDCCLMILLMWQWRVHVSIGFKFVLRKKRGN